MMRWEPHHVSCIMYHVQKVHTSTKRGNFFIAMFMFVYQTEPSTQAQLVDISVWKYSRAAWDANPKQTIPSRHLRWTPYK